MTKIRGGFVTNSSSTNHIILWKGKKNNLEKLLRLHQHVFPTSLDWDYEGLPSYKTTVDEIIDAIISKLDNAMHSNFALMNLEREIYSCVWTLKKGSQAWNTKANHYIKERMEQIDGEINALYDNDFDWRLVVSFGDNHGDFQGGELGNIMDYKGRDISIDSDELIYRTEQNR